MGFAPPGAVRPIKQEETALMRKFTPFLAMIALVLGSVVGGDFPTSWP